MAVEPTDIEKVKTFAGELNLSVQDLDFHAQDGLDFGHSKIIGKIPALEKFGDPETYPEVLNNPLYQQYYIIRQLFASSHILKPLSKHQVKSKSHFDTAVLLLDQLIIDYNNQILHSGSGGVGTTGGSNIATVHTETSTFPSNPDVSASVSSTVRRTAI